MRRPNLRNVENCVKLKVKQKHIGQVLFHPPHVYGMNFAQMKPNLLFYEGNRNNHIKQAQLHMQCSKLNAHIFLLHVVDSPQCIGEHEVEESEYFLFNCPLCLVQRQEMLQNLNQVNIVNVNLTMLVDCTAYDLKINQSIFKAIHEFLSASVRF